VPEVRVIGGDDGKTQLGIMPTHEALRIAEEGGLDLVEVSPKAVPPVCRIMDYGKFKYEQAKQKNKAKKHATDIILKEVKFRPKTDDHDFDFKVKHIRRFLGEGNKAKLVIVFRGREIVHPETGQAMLKAVFEAVQDIAVIEQNPMMEGRRMLMVLAPKGAGVRPAASTVIAAMPSSYTPRSPSPASASSSPSASAASPTSAPPAPRPAEAPAARPVPTGPTVTNKRPSSGPSTGPSTGTSAGPTTPPYKK
jgi:translation initiation factor IF-3